jgi:hypothetical protein
MPDNLREYEDRVRLTPSSWLGQAVAFRVAEACLISHSDLRAQLKAIGLEDFLPRAPKDEDVFRRVASGHTRKRVPTAVEGVFENYLIRDVARGSRQVTKQIVVEQVDGANKRLDYAPTVQLDYDSGMITSEVIHTTPVDPTQALNLADLITMDFNNERGHLNSYAIRGMLRSILDASDAVPFLTGGLYFVGPVWTNRITDVEGMKVPGMELHSFPIIDDKKQREMLRRSIEAETNEQMDKMLKEIEGLLAGPEITEAQFRQLADLRVVTKDKAKGYAEMLDETLDNTQFRMQMLDAAMRI